jgi:electron transfer flavoprotein beta subunit
VNIAVCIKHVPDSTTRVRIAEDGKSIAEEGVSFVINLFDRFAIAKAAEMAEAAGGEVTLFIIGTDKVNQDLKKALAEGGNKAVHIQKETSLDVYTDAKLFAAEIAKGDFQLVLTGKQQIDDDMAQMAQLIASELQWACVSNVVELHLDGDQLTAKQEIEGGLAQYEMKLPAVISAQKGLKKENYPPLKLLMKAKKLPVDKISPEQITETFVLEKMDLPPQKSAGVILENGAEDVPQLVDLLKKDAKVIG